MKRSNRLLLVVGIVLAALAFVAVLLLGGGGGGAPPEPPTVSVVAAATDIPLGTQITADMVTTAERPEAQAVDTYANPEEVVGLIVRRNVSSGQLIQRTAFEAGETVEIAGSIPAGQRAIAIALDKVGSVGYLVQAGDTVDIVLAVRDGDGLDPVIGPVQPGQLKPEFPMNPETIYDSWDDYLNNTTVKVLVENVQVLTILRPAPTTDPGAVATQDDPNWVAILAVSPADAELVRFAQLDGNLSLLLRNPEDRQSDPANTAGITLRRLVDEFGVLPPGPITSQPLRPQEQLLP